MTTTELEENIKRALPDALRMGIKEAKKHSYEVRKLAFEGINPVYNCASVLKEFGDEESMNHLEKITKEYATLERQMKDYKTYLEKVEAKIVKGDVVSIFKRSNKKKKTDFLNLQW
jgi:chaperonin cofactor prefoldin